MARKKPGDDYEIEKAAQETAAAGAAEVVVAEGESGAETVASAFTADETVAKMVDGELIVPAPPLADGRRLVLTLDAMRHLGFVESERSFAAEDGTPRTVVVTKGMRKLTFPGDEAIAGALPLHELDGSVPVSGARPTFLGVDAAENANRKAKDAAERAAKG